MRDASSGRDDVDAERAVADVGATFGEHPYARLLHQVEKPGQYVGGEPGERKKPWDSADARVCLAFPDLYEIGMSHLGFKILYGILNDHPRTLAERAYAVWPDMERALREHDEPLRSLESARPLIEFDVVGFSLQFELTYTNVLQMLELGGVPLHAADRTERHPLVLCGGPSSTHAEPMAAFVDAFVIGDGEEKAVEVALLWTDLRRAGLPRDARLRALASLGGVYVPALYETTREHDTGLEVVAPPADASLPHPIRRAFLATLDAHPFPSASPVPTTQTIFDRAGIEIARGCTEGCRFCQAGMIYRPVRERKPADVLEAIRGAVRLGGYEEASLTSLSTADYSAIAPLVRAAVEELRGTHVELSVSSLRAYGLSEDVLDDMATQRASGLTFAPEAGTQRMRDVINKNVTEAQLLETAERVFSRGWSKMKLYFMIGLPTEEDDDVVGIVHTGLQALEVGERILGRRRARVTVSVSSLVPKPHTPFQWCAVDDDATLRRKHRLLFDAARGRGLKLRTHETAGTRIEAILARGDRAVGALVLAAYRLGARFDSWDSELDPELWEAAIVETGLDVSLYLGTLPVDARLPWDHIDVGLEPGFLAREYRRALRGRLSPPCGKMAGQHVFATNVADARAETKRLVCYSCGVACDLDAMRGDRVAALQAMGAETPRVRLALADAPRTDRRMMRDVDQGPKVRLRVAYQKLGKLAYSAHLDVLRLVPRMLRRSGLPVIWSEGFTPAPCVSYGPALGLFVPSLAEYFDVELRALELGDDGDAALFEALRAASFDGLEVTGARLLGPYDASVTRVLSEAHYALGVPRPLLREMGLDDAHVATHVSARLASETLPFDRDHKGIKKRMDARPLLAEVEVGAGTHALALAGLAGDLLTLRVRTRLTPAGALRPSELGRVLLDLDEWSARVVRIGTFALALDGEYVSPLALERFRKPKSHEPSHEPTEVFA